MDGDAFIYVKKNDICICTTGVNSFTAQHFLREFFNEAKITHTAADFALVNAVDTQKFALISRNGIAKISMKATMYEASASYHLRKSQAIGLIGKVAKDFRALFGNGMADVGDDSLKVTLEFRADRRRKGGLAIGHHRLKRVAENVIAHRESEDEFTIELETGEKITPDDIVMSRVVELDAMGKSVQRDGAWQALLEYYQFLEEGALLEM